MTDDRSPDWDDARLDAAFRARAAAHLTPPDLAAASIERVRRSVLTGSRRTPLRYVSWLAAATAVAVIATLVSVGRPGTEPGTTLRPSATAVPPVMPILSVAEAIGVRDVEKTDREIAVRGYFSPAHAGLRCVASGFVENPVRLECPETFQWLLETPEPLSLLTSVLPAGRVGFQPVMPFLDTGALNRAADAATAGGPLVEAVFIGHFHDWRGHPNLCATGNEADCDGFVVDGIESVEGVRMPPSVVIDLEPFEGMPRVAATWAAADVRALLADAVPDLGVLSVVALPGHRIGELQPSLGTGALGVIDRDIVWTVTGLEPRDRAEAVRRTFLLVDGTAEAYEASSLDVVGFVPFHLIPLPAESPEPSASILPSAAAFPDEALGLPVIGVPEAVGRRDNRTDDTELAVRGYWYRLPIVTSCALPLEPPPPLMSTCNDRFRWLTAEATPLIGPPPDGSYENPPDGPAIELRVRHGVNWGVAGEEPLTGDAVVLVGHFHDRRAVDCSDAMRPECSAAFVVDAVVDPGDPRLGPTVTVEPALSVTATPEDLRRVVGFMGDVDPPMLVLASPIPGAGVEAVEPAAVVEAPELARAGVVWVVRYLDLTSDGRARIHTLLVIDGSREALLGSIYEPTAEGLLRKAVIID